MKDVYISFETAKLAKEKGFTEVSQYPLWFHENGKEAGMFEDLWNIKKSEYLEHECIIRSTQSLLQKWLREIKDIDVFAYSVRFTGYLEIGYYTYSIRGESPVKNYRFDTYEEALEFGLKEALKLI